MRDVPEGWDVPIEQCMIVELHSLSRAELNGRRGEAVSWDGQKERWAVNIIGQDGCDKMAVRPVNLMRAPPAQPEAAEAAYVAAEKACVILASIRQGQGPPQQLFAQAEALLKQAEEQDPASVVLHQTRGDAAHMRHQYAEQAKHARRAVANGHGLAAADGSNQQNVRRMALAAALGNSGALDGELEQVRAVLRAEPGHIHARLTLGQSLLDRGEFEAAVRATLKAPCELGLPPLAAHSLMRSAPPVSHPSRTRQVPELLMALQLPAEAKPPWPSMHPQQIAMFRDAACSSLSGAFGERAQQLAAQGEHRKAVEMLSERLLKLPGLEARKPDVAATALANLAVSHCALGETEAAECTLERARNLSGPDSGVGALKRAFVLTTCGHCKEQTADAWRGGRAEVDETAAALYAAASRYFRDANAIAEDPASRQGHRRVQVKVHPEMEWVDASAAFGSLAGMARCVNGGEVVLEELPPGPVVR